MNIRKIVAPNMAEAMKRIRSQLGEDAVILSSKAVYTGGFLGLFKKRNIEVIAASDPQASPPQPARKEKAKKRPEMTAKKNSAPPLSERKPVQDAALTAEIGELKKMVHSLSERQKVELQQFPEPLRPILTRLRSNELDEQWVAAVGQTLLARWSASKSEPSDSDIRGWALEAIMQLLKGKEFGPVQHSNKFVVLAGPTGVGKTTTLAKLAAEAILKEQKKAAFITTDTYRIAAIEQLKTYANLLNAPVEVAYEAEDFQQCAERLSDRDIIFVDTAGRNYRETKYINDLDKLLGGEAGMEVLLVLSMSMKEKDVDAIIENFHSIPVDRLIFTKVDETADYGTMVNMMMKHGKGAAYLTTGQDVPDDIEPASPERIARYILGDAD